LSPSADTRKVVVAALAGNVAIALCKFAAAYLSRSTATLAEAVHSLADTGNQALLLIGMRLAARPADDRFAFGRATEKYFWPFVVALMLFSVGGAFAVFDGTSHLLHPVEETGSRWWSYGVLGVSLLFEAMSFRVAYGEFKVMRGDRPWRQALLETRDPTIPLVLAEDTTALIGLTLALVAVLLSGLTGQAFWDPLGSVLIGLLLCGVAIVLARLTHGLLIGESAAPEDQQKVIEFTESTPGVVKVTQLLSMHLGPDVVLVALKVAFRPGAPVEEVEDTTNAIERKIRDAMPHMRKIFIEADSKGDGRGLFRQAET
jgi:cation diffusion facilitator family transporter